jgi:hypothetical protein
MDAMMGYQSNEQHWSLMPLYNIMMLVAFRITKLSKIDLTINNFFLIISEAYRAIKVAKQEVH